MKIELKDGHLWIDGKEVRKVKFVDYTDMRFPIDHSGTIIAEGPANASIEGDGNAVIQNSVIGSTIKCHSFRLGDG